MTLERVVYLAPGDVLKGRVEPILWMRTCEALAAAGLDVTLVAPYFFRRENIRPPEVPEHFGVAKTFRLSIVPTLLSTRLSGRSWVRLNLLPAFFVRLLPHFIGKLPPAFFSKGQVCMQVVRGLERVTRKRAFKIFELHSLAPDPRLERMLADMDLIVVNSQLLATRLEALGIRAQRIVQVYNPAFAIPQTMARHEARRRLKIRANAEVLTYSGKVTSGNLRFLLATAERLEKDGVEVHIVGGNPAVLREARAAGEKLDNLHFHGFVAPAQIGCHLSAADYLFCSYPDDQINIEQATPAKYFDYMHAMRPVLCSNNTAIRELWENGRNCLFFEAESPHDLREKLLACREQPDLGRRLVENNRRLIEGLTWDKRVRTILERVSALRREHANAEENRR